MSLKVLSLLVLAATALCVTSFSKSPVQKVSVPKVFGRQEDVSSLHARLSDKRRKQLGVGDDEDEYDLGTALEANTDTTITKIIAGSFIVVVIALLVVGVVVPSLTDYSDEGLW